MTTTDEVLRWCAEYIERDRRERFAKGDARAGAAIHLLLSIKELRAAISAQARASEAEDAARRAGNAVLVPADQLRELKQESARHRNLVNVLVKEVARLATQGDAGSRGETK